MPRSNYKGAKQRIVEHGTLGLFFGDQSAPGSTVKDLVLQAKTATQNRFRASTRLTADTYAVALRPEVGPGAKSIEVSARKLDGTTEILLFAKDLPQDWPSPYIFKDPVAFSQRR